jgi:hypothetical protein
MSPAELKMRLGYLLHVAEAIHGRLISSLEFEQLEEIEFRSFQTLHAVPVCHRHSLLRQGQIRHRRRLCAKNVVLKSAL